MERVTVRIVDLLEKLKANRETHKATYEAARVGYREQAIEMFKAELTKAEKGWDFRNNVYLEPPQDHTNDYDNAIEMLEMSLEASVKGPDTWTSAVGTVVTSPEEEKKQRATIEISRKDFACYVRDDWGWKAEWFANTSTYTISEPSS